MTAADEETPDLGATEGGEAPAPVEAQPVVVVDKKVEEAQRAENQALVAGEHYKLRRFLITSSVFLGIWLLGVALIHTGTPALFYLLILTPPYLITLLIAMRPPKALRKKEKTLKDRLSFSNKLTIAILTFVAIYLPFTFISNRIIPLAPLVEFGLFITVLYLLYRLVGRSVGVAPSLEALPPANHRRHKQVVLPIDDPHYQKTLFLNYEFVDRGRGARQLAKRLDAAMEQIGIEEPRRRRIVEDLDEYREGFHFGLGLTRGGRERNRGRRERRNLLLRTVYNKFNMELENRA